MSTKRRTPDARKDGSPVLAEIARKREAAHERFLELDSEVYKRFLALERAAFKDGVLPKKTKELIALGISVAKDCESCMQWHVEKAVEAGASREELLETLEVAIEMGGGPATVSCRFALHVMDEVLGR